MRTPAAGLVKGLGSKRRVRVLLLTTTTVVAALAAPSPASAAYTRTTTPLRACTNIHDSSCAAWASIPANTTISLRCWIDDTPYAGTVRWFWISGYGVQGFVSANQVGAQYTTPWCENDHYVRAVRWAGSHLGELYDVNACQTFVREAYYYGSSWNIGSGYDAYPYWRADPHGYPRYYDTNPPVGALVYWKPDPYSSVGHVAISIGSGRVISTYERSTRPVHIFRIADRNLTKPYAGYLVPR